MPDPLPIDDLSPVERLAADVLAQRHSPGGLGAWRDITDASPRVQTAILRDVAALCEVGLVVSEVPPRLASYVSEPPVAPTSEV